MPPAEFQLVLNGTEANGKVQAYNPQEDESFRNPADEGEIESFTAEDEEHCVAEGKGRKGFQKEIEFVFACISVSVGLGNIWRFPFVLHENGGGAFLIPYFIVLFLIGKPMYFLELVVGQFSSSGPVKIWKMSPICKGIGYGITYGGFCVISYYCVLVSITIYYFISSFQSTLPWSVCNSDWEGILCVDGKAFSQNKSTGVWNVSENVAEQFLFKNVQQKKLNIDDGIGAPGWELTLCLLAAWLIIFGSLFKGMRSSGKVAYVTAIFPYVILIILLIRGLTLKGALEGVGLLLTPDFSVLLKAKVWSAALGQCLFSLAIGFGPIIMFASYTPFTTNVYKYARMISFLDTFTGLLAGVTMFSILGHLAVLQSGGVTADSIKAVAKGGNSLAFVFYPTVISTLPVPQLFAALFFLMMMTLGIGTAGPQAAAIITVIQEKFPKVSKLLITSAVCVAGFLSGLIYVTPGGAFMITLVDKFGVEFVIVTTAFFEVTAVAWIYGLNNIARDIKFMLGLDIGWYWKLCWGFVIPLLLAVIWINMVVAMSKDSLKEEGVSFPTSALVCGWLLLAGGLLTIPIGAIHAISQAEGDGVLEKIRNASRPKKSFGPYEPKIHRAWKRECDRCPTQDYLGMLVNRSKIILRKTQV